ncbi:MAG: Hpt domain-containing protein [Pirellulaceae bacterium]
MTKSGSFVQDEFFDSLLSDFLDESSQLLDRLNENLLELDEWVTVNQGQARCDLDLLNDMFRSAHSVKGLSAMLGLSSVNSLTHKIENVFDAARKDELRLDGHAVEVVFQSIDLLVAMIQQLKETGTDEMQADHVNDLIQTLLEGAGCARQASSQAEAEAALTAIDAVAQQPSQAAASPASPTREPVENLSTMPRIDYFADIADEGEVPAKYLTIFIDETFEALDSLAETLVSGESEGGASTETLLITSHRVKGSAASVGLNRPAKLAHLMEDILHELRESGRSLTSEMTDAMLGCTDALRQYVDGLRGGSPESGTFNDLAHALLDAKARANGVSAAGGESTTDVDPPALAEEVRGLSPDVGESPPSEADALSSAWDALASQPSGDIVALAREKALHNGPAVVGRVLFEPNLPLVGLKARLVYEKLQHVDEVFWCEPPADQLEELDQIPSLTFALAGDHDGASLRGRLSVAGVASIELTSLSNFDPPQETERRPEAPSARREDDAPGEDVAMQNDSAGRAAPVNTRSPASDAKPPAPKAADIDSVVATPVGGGSSRPAEAASRRSRTTDTTGVSKPNETLRVDIERLDQLMNLAGQLVINKARFTQIGDGFKGAMPSKQTPQLLANAAGVAAKILEEMERTSGGQRGELDHDAMRSQVRRLHADLEIVLREIGQLSQMRGRVTDLFEAVHQLDRVADGIQQSVMDTRMVPIGPLFGRFKRVVRDITRGNGKDIRLTIRGEKTELDKRMIDELGDPLIHMVRNSADHGVESPQQRADKGKPPQGEIVLDAFHRGNSIYIQVKDDGKGLDRERILAKALDKQIITPADAEKLTPHQVNQLIWEPGFSTAETVTEISGRGMGMDIVRSKIEDLNGAVEVESELGVGTTFTIKLPLTLAILPSLMAEIDGDVYALPIESVVEIVSIPTRELSTVHGLATATIRGRIVSVVDLNQVFTWHPDASRRSTRATEPADSTIVVIGQEGKELGMLVHALLGEEDVVIKSLAENYRNVPGIAGASILGDGRVSLILDVNALIEMSSNAAAAAPV